MFPLAIYDQDMNQGPGRSHRRCIQQCVFNNDLMRVSIEGAAQYQYHGVCILEKIVKAIVQIHRDSDIQKHWF